MTSSNGSERLDRIEASLEQLVGVVSSNRQDIDILSERIGQLALSVSELRQSQAESQQQQLETQQGQAALIDILVQTMHQFEQQADSDRAIMLQILQFLQNQYPGNGKRS